MVLELISLLLLLTIQNAQLTTDILRLSIELLRGSSSLAYLKNETLSSIIIRGILSSMSLLLSQIFLRRTYFFRRNPLSAEQSLVRHSLICSICDREEPFCLFFYCWILCLTIPTLLRSGIQIRLFAKKSQSVNRSRSQADMKVNDLEKRARFMTASQRLNVIDTTTDRNEELSSGSPHWLRKFRLPSSYPCLDHSSTYVQKRMRIDLENVT